MRTQTAIVRTKQQLIAALTMAINCPAGVHITMKLRDGTEKHLDVKGPQTSRPMTQHTQFYERKSQYGSQLSLPMPGEPLPPAFEGQIQFNRTYVDMQETLEHAKLIKRAIAKVRKTPVKELF